MRNNKFSLFFTALLGFGLAQNALAIPFNQTPHLPILMNTKEPVTMKYLVLLQPQEIVQNRVNSPTDIADFAKKVNAVVSPVLSQIQDNQGFVVVIVNDKGEIRVWLDLKLLPSEQVEKQLIAQIQQIKPFAVKQGMVGVALAYETGNEVMAKEFPHPIEWQKALGNQTENIDFDSFIAKIWNQ